MLRNSPNSITAGIYPSISEPTLIVDKYPKLTPYNYNERKRLGIRNQAGSLG